eukprot:Filipodium_phascolosomae@DN494_c0_g1_i1.p1
MEMPEGCQGVVVKNLSYSATEENVRATFEFCGAITGVRIPLNDEGQMRGMAYIDFEDMEAIQAAQGLNGQELLGREMRIEFAHPRGSGGRGGRGGGRGGGGGYRGRGGRW